MNSFENRSSESRAGSAEETLRLIANLPAPKGLTERLQAELRQTSKTGRVLSWPARPRRGWIHSSGLRGAAAAAIVCIVAGGAWTIASRIQPMVSPAAKAAPLPARTGNTGGFSSANAIRTPQTLNGPVLTHVLTMQQADDEKIAAPSGQSVQPAPSSSGKVKSGSKAKKTPQPASAVQ